MLYPPVADLLKNVDSRYLLVNVVAHRARQFAAEAEALQEELPEKPVTLAIQEVAEQNGVSHVSKVVMNIGEVSTVVPEYLTDCWRWAADKEELLKGCELEVIVTDAVTVCNTCGKEYPTVEHGKNCPFCGSADTVLLRGNEVEIKEIEV